jgi:thiamine-phosphate pyrophosphorylase
MAVFAELPLLYPILDAGLLAQSGAAVEDFARGLREAGVRFLQYRDKDGSEREVLERAAFLRSIFPAADSCLILNDRVALAAAARFDGVHVGQDDMQPSAARRVLGRGALIGLSTHDERQLRLAGESSADYVAIGPIFSTFSKQNPDPVVGLEMIRVARRLTAKPLVAIGGITRANCVAVLDAGADSVAVVSDLLPRSGESVQSRVREFLARFSSRAI